VASQAYGRCGPPTSTGLPTASTPTDRCARCRRTQAPASAGAPTRRCCPAAPGDRRAGEAAQEGPAAGHRGTDRRRSPGRLESIKLPGGRQVEALALDCLWYGVLGALPVRVVIVRDRARRGLDISLLRPTRSYPPSSSSRSTRRAGRSRSTSSRPRASSASAKRVTEPGGRSSAPSPLAFCARRSRSAGTRSTAIPRQPSNDAAPPHPGTDRSARPRSRTCCSSCGGADPGRISIGQAAGPSRPKNRPPPPNAGKTGSLRSTKVEDTYFSDVRFFLVLWYTEKTRLTERSDFTLAAYTACSSPHGSGSLSARWPRKIRGLLISQPDHPEPVVDGSTSGGVPVRNL
jgi:hypothetical protein